MPEHLAFDLEIAAEVPDGGDWDAYRPFGISIASCMTDEFEAFTWPDDTMLQADGRYVSKLAPHQAEVVADFLLNWAGAGKQIITFNGLGFDFRVLCEELYDNLLQRALAQLAMSEAHIDIGFAMVCDLGFMCSLQGACEGMSLPGKSDGVTGKLIPALWKGSRYDQEKCLDYCRNDVAMTSLVYQGMQHHGKLQYNDKQGVRHVWTPRNMQELDVVHAQQCPEIGKPRWKRSKFTDWLADYA